MRQALAVQVHGHRLVGEPVERPLADAHLGTQVAVERGIRGVNRLAAVPVAIRPHTPDLQPVVVRPVHSLGDPQNAALRGERIDDHVFRELLIVLEQNLRAFGNLRVFGLVRDALLGGGTQCLAGVEQADQRFIVQAERIVRIPPGHSPPGILAPRLDVRPFDQRGRFPVDDPVDSRRGACIPVARAFFLVEALEQLRGLFPEGVQLFHDRLGLLPGEIARDHDLAVVNRRHDLRGGNHLAVDHDREALADRLAGDGLEEPRAAAGETDLDLRRVRSREPFRHLP